MNINQSPDPYLSLVIECKEQAKDPKTAYVRQVTSAPEPIVLLATDEQLDDVIKFCTNDAHFGIFQADPTFSLGAFSVTTTQYEHLLLVNRRSGKNPVIVGPMMIHQRKGKDTYKVLPKFLAAKRPQFKNLCALGTDGERPLSDAFLETCPDAKHLICSIHFRKNVIEHLKSVGIDEMNRKLICDDIFGHQIGTRFEEGIVDSDDEYQGRLDSLRGVWEERIGKKGLDFYQWFMKWKSRLVKEHLLKPVRIAAGLGDPPKPYVSNRVECVNSLLKRETERKESPVDAFAKMMQDLVERQARNVRWAIIDKGPFKIHSSLNHFKLSSELWLSMPQKEKDEYMQMFMKSSVVETIVPHVEATSSAPLLDDCSEVDLLPPCPIDNVNSGLSVLAAAALSVSDEPQDATNIQTKISLGFDEFKDYLPDQPLETVRGMIEKAVELLCKPGGMSPAPGCDPHSKMVASHRFKDRPHLVTKGKAKGEYRCEKNCPHWNGMKICSHTIATAEKNGELLLFLQWYKRSRGSKAINLSSVVRTDMPLYPGRKGGVPATTRRAHAKLPVEERVKRTYSDRPAASNPEPPNTNPFVVKEMNNKIQKCQGCKGSLRCASQSIPPAPFDFCISRKERRSYYDKNGLKHLPARESDAHYHLKMGCVQAAEPLFDSSFLVIPHNLPLTDQHLVFISKEFGLQFNDS
ncbi:hypothetical protein QZH41_006225 [Actinostola sp. cb2023]|nr:hypothetical protein QZH41_006225 [Actinostola sp. cb2023]